MGTILPQEVKMASGQTYVRNDTTEDVCGFTGGFKNNNSKRKYEESMGGSASNYPAI
jgi:hypothetical protein